jgi:predicted CXXCH cytochrome family protein
MGKGSFLFVFLPVIPIFGLFTGQMVNNRNFTEHVGVQSVERNERTCLDCHSDLLEWKIQHTPAKNGCNNCHETKLSEHPEKISKGLFLTKEMPDLCYGCHEGVKQEIDTTRFVHKAVKEEKQCANCHSPHAADVKKLLIAEKNKLCLSCHDKETTKANGERSVNIKQLLADSKVIHPAIKGGCTSCHKPHASTENYLLISAFPRERYVKARSSSFALCWECHDIDLYDAPKTTTATSFRNGDQNLHHIHLTGARGRSCVICHDVHASNNKALIIDKVAFGQWKFDMNFVPSDSGGSCYPGCHNLATYKR